MSNNYRATPKQWEMVQDYGESGWPFFTPESCILELRARVEELEANVKPTPNSIQTRSSLVERVADAILASLDRDQRERFMADCVAKATHAGIVDDRPARAAIREVAAWISQEPDGHLGSNAYWVGRLQQESKR